MYFFSFATYIESKGFIMKLSEMQERKKINDDYNDLKNCSEGELYQKLEDEIKKQKNDGVFNYQALISSIEKIKNYLPKENYENMLRIIKNLK